MRILILFLLSPSLFATAILDYDRSEWRHWVDSDNDCQNTRHELLLRESLEPVAFKTDAQCQVKTGLWYGQYLGVVFSESSDLDHIIPLKWAHDHGGWRWNAEDKQRFANDYQNLILVDDGRNQSKGAKGPGEWMPDNSAYHCMYVFRWSYLIDKYNLTANQVDKDKIGEVERGCVLDKPAERLQAYEYVQQGWAKWYKYTREANDHLPDLLAGNKTSPTRFLKFRA